MVSANVLMPTDSPNDDGRDYEFATHVVKVKRSGQGKV